MARKSTAAKMFVTIDRDTLDDAVFNGVQEMIDAANLPMAHRAKLRVADQIAEGVMKVVDAEGTMLGNVRAKRRSKVVKDTRTGALPHAPPDSTTPTPFGASK